MDESVRVEEYKKKLSSALAVVMGVIDMAKEHGLFMSFNIGDDPITGKQKINHITVTKKL